jgi:Flp pilus assembly pilin Flp
MGVAELTHPPPHTRGRVATLAHQEKEKGMSRITKLVVRAREFNRGQTMAEYALIMAAVAVVVFVGYQTMGTTITTLLTTVDGSL